MRFIRAQRFNSLALSLEPKTVGWQRMTNSLSVNFTATSFYSTVSKSTEDDNRSSDI